MYAQIERWVIFTMAILFFGSNTVVINRSVCVHFSKPTQEASYVQPSDFFSYDVWDMALLNSAVEESLASEYAASDKSVNLFLGTSLWLTPSSFLLATHSQSSEGHHWSSWQPLSLFRLYCNWRL